ncbi:MAG: hypothetical protein HOW59_37020 [Nonomuraea sp.]|nr:hypothetical protein [Nonomuraea sp.]NUQ31333.1 hypothetical protein [Dermatophilaceae bacterium]NUR81041.1 hypothetical protein [Dermatophilaceae bacterium]
MPKATPNFETWLQGLGSVEADHVFTPVGKQSPAMTRLLVERAAIMEQAATGGVSDDVEEALGGESAVGEVERAVGQSYTESLDDIDARIAAQLEEDHPDAPRFRLRGLTDDDYTEVQKEIVKLTERKGAKWTDQDLKVEANLRFIQRAVLEPAMTLMDARALRKHLNRGEWARLLSHVTRLANLDAEATDLPN